MNNTKKSLAVLAVAALAVGALAPVASARGLGGFGGHADNPSQATSFSEDWNAVVWNGSNSARWDIPLVVDSTGSYSPIAYVYGSVSTTSCSVQAVSQDQSTISNTTWVSPQGFLGEDWASVQPGGSPGVTVVANGSLEIACFLGNGEKIQTVTW